MHTSFIFLEFVVMAHITRVSLYITADEVIAALTRANFCVWLADEPHKSQCPEQSHGRWQIDSNHRFEIHPGYSERNRRHADRSPDCLIVQGRHGWDPAILDSAADVLINLAGNA